MGAAMLGQPIRQREQTRRCGIECADFSLHLTVLSKPHGRDNGVLVHIQASTTRVKNLHAFLPSCATGAGHPQRKV